MSATYEDHGFGSCSGAYLDGQAHLGADSQGTSAGQAVRALGSGTVVQVHAAGWSPGGAIGVETSAGDGARFLAVYGHINRSVNQGQAVTAGQAIGTIADDGRNSHLHLGVRPLSAGETGGSVLMAGNSDCANGSAPSYGYVNPIPWLAEHGPNGASWPIFSRGYQIAFQSSAGELWSVGSAGSRNLGYGMRAGTSPSIAPLRDGGHQIAFQSSAGELWSVGSAGSRDLNYGVRDGTSPSITGLAGGGHQIAFQSSAGDLWTVGSAGSRDLDYGMRAGTGPSIAALSDGGYQIAFQSSAGELWTAGSAGTRNLGYGMRAGTSPSIAALTRGGYQIAFQSSAGDLWSVGSAGSRGLSYGMRANTSPSITGLADGGHQIAFQSSAGDLWSVGSAGSRGLSYGMRANTSPSITGLADGGHQIAFQSSAGELWTVGSGENRNLNYGMRANTSPGIGPGTGHGVEVASTQPSPDPTPTPPSNAAPAPPPSTAPTSSTDAPATPPPPPPTEIFTAPSLPPFAAKLEVERARVLRSDRALDVLAPITARASGNLAVDFHSSGRHEKFDVAIDAENRRARFTHEISKDQAELGTGIVTLTYGGDVDTQPQEVRLRAASGKAHLDAKRPVIEDGRLKAKGDISSRARGVVRLQLLYEPPGQDTQTLEFKAKIDDGEYRFDAKLPQEVLQGIANRRGVVHSYTLFTGYFERRIRGEMQSYQVLGPG